MFDNFRRFGRICSVISVGSVRFGSVTGFIHSPLGTLQMAKRSHLSVVAKSHSAILHICSISLSYESTFVMVTRRFAPWRLYTSAELYESNLSGAL